MFQFVTVGHPEEIKDRKKQAKIRRHAIRNGIQRKSAKRAKNNPFVFIEFENQLGQASKQCAPLAVITNAPSKNSPGPCDTLGGSPERLWDLMRHSGVSKASLESSNKSFFRKLEIVFRGASADPALLHALSHIPSLASKSTTPMVEVLSYRGGLLNGLRVNIKRPGWMPKVSTITAMLLLIGYEYQLDGANSDTIATHLYALKAVMEGYKARNASLLEGVQVALFWQDLGSCLTARTPRLISHEEFNTFRRVRNFGRDEYRDIPSGFISGIREWPKEFINAVQDLNALCRLVDARCGTEDELLEDIEIDNYQANLQSRLADLLSENRNMEDSRDPVYEACIFAAYLCTCRLSTGIWKGCPIPEVCVNHIIQCVKQATRDAHWIDAPELLFWLLFVGGGLTHKEHTRLQIITLMQNLLNEYFEGLIPDWETWKIMLQRYVWSERAMERAVFSFWEEVHFGWKSTLSERC